MSWFPLFVQSQNKKCLVVGGGTVALHKLKILSNAQFDIKVVAVDVLPEIQAMPIEICLKKIEKTDLESMEIVIDATGNKEIGIWLSDVCAKRRILFNAVDCPELCSFIFPAMLHRGKLTAAISTAGASPVAAAWVRDQVNDMLPDCFDEILFQMEQLRPKARQKILRQEQRAAFLKRCFSVAIEEQRTLSNKELEALWKENQ